MSEEAPRRPAGRWIRGGIAAFATLCFAWVLWPILRDARELREGLAAGELIRAVVVGALGYALISVTLALAWWWLAGIYRERPPLRAGYVVYARSQLAKYLPGNAFHYVSRQLLGRRTGLGHPALVASGVLELASLVLASLLVAGATHGLARGAPASGFGAWPWALALGLGGLLVWPALDLALRRLPWTESFLRDLPHLSARGTLRLLGPSLALHLVFFAGTGVLLVALAAASRPDLSAQVWRLLWIYPIAWLAGTVSVGAPAGIGVREAILTLALEPLVGPAQAAAVALAFRLVTTGGDLVSAGLGWWLDEPGDDTLAGADQPGTSMGRRPR